MRCNSRVAIFLIIYTENKAIIIDTTSKAFVYIYICEPFKHWKHCKWREHFNYHSHDIFEVSSFDLSSIIHHLTFHTTCVLWYLSNRFVLVCIENYRHFGRMHSSFYIPLVLRHCHHKIHIKPNDAQKCDAYRHWRLCEINIYRYPLTQMHTLSHTHTYENWKRDIIHELRKMVKWALCFIA